jgi:hypothetical protein
VNVHSDTVIGTQSNSRWHGPADGPYVQVRSTAEQANHMELALGTHGRSCEQWDIWQAVYSPQGEVSKLHAVGHTLYVHVMYALCAITAVVSRGRLTRQTMHFAICIVHACRTATQSRSGTRKRE